MTRSLPQDLVYSARTLLRRPGFALLAILTVALGVGINTAMFTIVNGVLWKSMPYPEADRLVMFNEGSSSGPLNCSGPNLEDWKKRSALFEDIAIAREFPPATLRLESATESIPTGYTHPNLFSLLGVTPAMGRLFTAQQDVAGAEPVAAITHRAWERYFGSDPAIIGRHVRIHISFENITVESMVVGAVLPADFRYENVDLWLPLNRFAGQVDAMRGNHWFRGIGKMKAGVTMERAQAELTGIARDLEQQYPATNRNVRPMASGLIEYYAGRVRTPLMLLFGAVGFVMLIACGNVVHLLLTRTLGRRREIAVRLALGAARGRLLQLLLAESAIIAVTGGALGVLLSHWAVTWALATQPRTLPRAATIEVDGTALLYALGITALTFCILGLTPLWQASRANVAMTLQSAGRGGTDRRQRRLGWGMVAAELAMASILLAGAGLMIQTLRNLSVVNLGYQPEGVVAVPISLPAYKYSNDGQVASVTATILRNVASLPGFVSAAYAEPFQLGGNGMTPPMTVPGRANPEPAPLVPTIPVSPEFFETMGIPLRAGRFPSKDVKMREVLVNQEFAQRFFPGEDPVGKQISMGGVMEVVGVVGNTRLQGPITATKAEVYWSSAFFLSPTLLVRVAGSPDRLIAGIREKVKSAEPETRIGTIRPLSAAEADRTALQRFTRSLLLLFAGLAVVLASLGIYGVVSYTVAQRTREIGIRMALGASRTNVAKIVLQQTLGATAIGVLAGAGGANLLARFLSTQLYGVTAHDPGIYAAVIGVISGVSLAAASIPMMRAAQIDPAICLREQ